MKKHSYYIFTLAVFLIQIGVHFYTIALSAACLIRHSSILISSGILLFSYAPAMLLNHLGGSWLDKNLSYKLQAFLVILISTCTILTAISVSAYSYFWLAYILLSIRSISWMLLRSSFIRILKIISKPETQSYRIQLFYGIYFISILISGWLLYETPNNLFKFAAIECGFSLIGFALLFVAKQNSSCPFYTTATILNKNCHDNESHDKTFLPAFINIIGSQGIFQGAYMTLVVNLPIAFFHLQMRGVSKFQIFASIGIIIGFLVNCIDSHKNNLFVIRNENILSTALTIIGLITILLIGIDGNVKTSFALFFAMNLVYELVWLYWQTAFFKNCPSERIAHYQFKLNVYSGILMSTFALFLTSLLAIFQFRTAIVTYTLTASFIYYGARCYAKSYRFSVASKPCV